MGNIHNSFKSFNMWCVLRMWWQSFLGYMNGALKLMKHSNLFTKSIHRMATYSPTTSKVLAFLGKWVLVEVNHKKIVTVEHQKCSLLLACIFWHNGNFCDWCIPGDGGLVFFRTHYVHCASIHKEFRRSQRFGHLSNNWQMYQWLLLFHSKTCRSMANLLGHVDWCLKPGPIQQVSACS